MAPVLRQCRVAARVHPTRPYNRHHGIQTWERFGVRYRSGRRRHLTNEMTQGRRHGRDPLFQATLPVPGRVIPQRPRGRGRAIAHGRAASSATIRLQRTAMCRRFGLSRKRPGKYLGAQGPSRPPGQPPRPARRSQRGTWTFHETRPCRSRASHAITRRFECDRGAALHGLQAARRHRPARSTRTASRST